MGQSLRINDGKGEGVLFVNRGKPTLVRFVDSLPQASVHRRNLENEVGLSYALFNARCTPIDHYQLISWEAPLLRPTKGLSEILKVKCDLIAYNAKHKKLVAVEVKLNPENDATTIQHGLLQAMTYGRILQHCLEKDRPALEQQVKKCLSEWCRQEVQAATIKKVAYALAAPKEYFVQSSGMYGWVEKAVRIRDVHFDGFWVLNYGSVVASRKSSDSRCIPTVDCDVSRVSGVKDLPGF